MSSRGLGNQVTGSGNLCQLCGKEDHEAFYCTMVDGCGKCGTPQLHKVSECEKPDYPAHDKQVCDLCFKGPHESKKCRLSIEHYLNPRGCKKCGHPDHESRQCPLVSQGTKLRDVAENKAKQFTPACWEAFVKARQEKNPSLVAVATPPPNATRSSPSKSPPRSQRPIASPSSNGHKISSGSPSSSRTSPGKLTADLQSMSLSEGQTVEQRRLTLEADQKRWRKAENTFTAAPPKRQKDSKDVVVKSNFFKIQLLNSVNLHRYSITLGEIRKPGNDEDQGAQEKPEVKRKLKREMKRQLIEQLLIANEPDHNIWATDYDSTIISQGPLFADFNTRLQMRETPHPQSSYVDSSTPEIDSFLTFLGKVNATGLTKHVSRDAVLENPEYELQALNIISWKNINKSTFEGGRIGKKFYPSSLINKDEEDYADKIGKFLVIRHGFFSSMRPGDGSILLNVNLTTSAFYMPLNLLAWMKRRWSDWPSPQDFQRELRGVRVDILLTEDDHEQTRIIRDISPFNANKTCFVKNKVPRFVAEYLQETWPSKYDPVSDTVRCVNVGNDVHKIWYPVDLLRIANWQIVKGVIHENYTQDIVDIASKRPQQCKDLIMGEGLQHLGLRSKFYQDFGIKPTLKMLELGVPHSKPPKLLFGDSTVEPVRASWNLASRVFSKGARTCRTLNIIWFPQTDVFERYENNTRTSITVDAATEELRRQIKKTGVSPTTNDDDIIGYSIARVTAPSREPKESYRKRCATMLNDSLDSLSWKTPLIFVVLLSKDLHLYPEIKRWGDCEKGIPTVCVTFDKLKANFRDPTFCGNLCLKLNSKLNGINHKIFSTFGKSKGMSGVPLGTMIVGADVTHPGTGNDHCPSLAAVVATSEDDGIKYLGSARLQSWRQEHIADLRGMIKERVTAWSDHAKFKQKPGKERLPSHILFYRDGVSESQYGMVKEDEQQQIMDGYEDALQAIRENESMAGLPTKSDLKLTLIVVTKRHHTRFYPLRDCPTPGDKFKDSNSLSGLVADTDVVPPNQFSFYLQSHHSQLGTARSSHYVVISDDNKYSAKDLQNSTHNICYTCSRATRALSVCTPARYADILCDRLRCYMKPALDDWYHAPESFGADRTAPPEPGISPPPEDYMYYEKDPNVWKPALTSTRKNPWHSNLDKVMFYL